MSGATDPINPVNPFFYLFGPFLAKIRKNQKSIKIPLIFPMLALLWQLWIDNQTADDMLIQTQK